MHEFATWCVVDLTSSAAAVTHVMAGDASVSVVTYVIPGDAPVTGVTSLGDDVFVVRYDQSQQVEVYDAVTFTLQRSLSVPGLCSESHGLAACASNKCLYASDYCNALVHRVELTGSNAVTKWSVGRPMGLTVNSANNVVVVIQDERKLQEFTTHGTLLHTIHLQPDIKDPREVTELTSGQFVISHRGMLHRVCLLDVKGAVVKSYGGTLLGSDLTKMSRLRGLAVDKHGNILVADWDNNRLLVIDRSLTSAHEMSMPVDGGLNGPRSLWYDKSRGRLYVGEGRGRRVIIIDYLKDFTASHVSPQS